MKALKQLTEKLNRHLVRERENNPHDTSIGGWFMFGNHKVDFFMVKGCCEVVVENVAKGTYLDNVSLYCEQHCVDWDDMDIDIEVYDIWNEHGFRDEADYINWRYR